MRWNKLKYLAVNYMDAEILDKVKTKIVSVDIEKDSEGKIINYIING